MYLSLGWDSIPYSSRFESKISTDAKRSRPRAIPARRCEEGLAKQRAAQIGQRAQNSLPVRDEAGCIAD